MKSKFRIKGLDCANCAAELERAIKKIKRNRKSKYKFYFTKNGT